MGEETALGKFLAQNETACPPKSRDACEPCPARPQSLQLWPPPAGFRRGEDGALEQPYLRKRDDVTGCQACKMQAGRPGTQLDPYFSLCFNHKLVSSQTQKKSERKGNHPIRRGRVSDSRFWKGMESFYYHCEI